MGGSHRAQLICGIVAVSAKSCQVCLLDVQTKNATEHRFPLPAKPITKAISRASRYQHVTTERVTHYPKSGASAPGRKMIRGNFQIPACHYRKSDPLPQEWCLQPPTSRNSRYQHVTTERVTHYPKSGASSPVPVLAALTDTELQIPACHYRKSDPLPQEWCLQLQLLSPATPTPREVHRNGPIHRHKFHVVVYGRALVYLSYTSRTTKP